MSIIWKPSQSSIENSAMSKFAKFASTQTQRNFDTWQKLYDWSVSDLGSFWELCSEYVQIRWKEKPHTAFVPLPEGKMRGAKWFVGGTLNFCENILPPPDDRVVLISLSEDAERHITGLQLHNEVAKLAQYLKTCGVGKNDVVSGVVCNTYHAIAAMLATTSLGAIWSSCSPDFGAEAILDRLGQVKPKVCFFSLSYHYNSHLIDCAETVESVMQRIPSLKSAIGIQGPKESVPKSVKLYSEIVRVENNRHPERSEAQSRDLLQSPTSSMETPLPLTFEYTNFDHPVYILFSSGTTGVPKCIVHGAGGTLLQHKKEHILHCNLNSDDRLFFFTTCGWMMWNWMATGLACGASVLVYEGSPRFLKQGLWQTVAEHKVTVFGTSPKFISLSQNEGWVPKKDLDFNSLRSVLSTGSPLLPEHFTWVMEHVKEVPIASISGGTDIVSCFMLGNPMLPIHSGEIQSAGLGMAISAYDENAKPVFEEKGELVCTQPFVSMPLYFLNDADGSRYKSSYFSHFENSSKEVWRHGDYISIAKHGGITVHGRSDATLNPGGVRIGSSELYRCVESISYIEDSLALSYEFEKGDPVILLFVKLKQGSAWDSAFTQDIKQNIRKTLSARHVPHSIFSVQEIPYTRNGKKVELAAKQSLYGENVPNRSALSNPTCLQEFVTIGKTLRNK